MNFQPSNFYISIIDLFAILLPGAIASMVIYHFYRVPMDDFLNIGDENTGFYSGFVLLFSSYLLGHIIGQISAYLDEWVYDPLKKKVFEDHKGVDRVIKIREEKYGNVLDPVYVNTYKWSVFKLQQEQPHAAAEIERYMADSKFFRSLFVLLIILLVVFLFPDQQNLLIALICLLLAAFSMIRYFKKRRKSTETAYQYIIFSEELNQQIKNTNRKEKVANPKNENRYRSNNSPSFKKYQSKLASLQMNVANHAAYIEIPAKESWKTSAANNETWCCLQGRGSVKFPDISKELKIVVIPNASISIPKNKAINIENTGDEPLLIAAF